MSSQPDRPPLLIIALDAGDAGLIEQWANDGSLPTIAALLERGCRANVAGPEMVSPDFGIWLSLLSGVPPHLHGYYYFRQLVPRSYDLRLFTHRDTGILPFWSRLRGTQKKVAVIDPPESGLVPGLEGIQLTGWGSRHIPQIPMKAAADSPQLAAEARRVFGSETRIGDFSGKNVAADRHAYRQLLTSVGRKGRLFKHFLSKDRYDLIVVGVYEAHTAAHRFWEYNPELGGMAIGRNGMGLEHAVRSVYQAIDKELHQLLAILPSEATTVLLSCYGMESMYPTTGLIEAFCHQLGYQARSSAGGATSHSGKPMSLLRRLVPQSWRTALSHHLPTGLQERALADHFRSSSDWSRTQAFSIPSLYTSFVRVNLRGREPQGLIRGGAEYNKLLDELEAELMQAIDPLTGKAAILRIDRSARTTDGKISDCLPDLFVRWRPGKHFMSRLTHPQARLDQDRPGYFRGSAHSEQGLFIAAGPMIQARGTIGQLSLLDMAPTLLELMGESAPPEMAGKSFAHLLGRRLQAST